MMSVIFDTSAFTSFEGKHPKVVFEAILRNLPPEYSIYMTPSCYEELPGFIELDKVDKLLLRRIQLRSPKMEDVEIKGQILKELVCDFRFRGDKAMKSLDSLMRQMYQTAQEDAYQVGLRDGNVEEKKEADVEGGSSDKAGAGIPTKKKKGKKGGKRKFMGLSDGPGGKRDPIAPYITRMRKSMRHFMREGILDSGADVEAAFLTLELGGYIMCADLGLVKWVHRMGGGSIDAALYLS